MTSGSLPVAAVLGEVAAALRGCRRVVIQAPPGSGKTTLVPPFLLDSGLCPRGEIVVLQPRRVAARTVARRIAAGLHTRLGERVGYQVRFEKRVGPRTRIRVVTEGILTAWIQRDPSLEGVAAVVLDEVHERSIAGDLALAFVREIQEALRDDLLLVVMSATVDAEPLARYLGGCPVVTSDGRLFPVTIEYLERPMTGRLEAAVARGVLGLVDDGPGGDILVFLPGVREILATQRALEDPLGARGWSVSTLYGRMSPRAQDAALEPGARPRVVLATNIAETSLTIANIGAVVDSGLAKIMRFEPTLGSGRLVTERISLASADQRAGRAGRLGPGRALRLWTEHEQRRLSPFDTPAIRREDLAPLRLELAAWGARDVAAFPLLDSPDPARLAQAEATLSELGALTPDGGLSARGRRLRRITAHPRIAAFLLSAADVGLAPEAAWWAAALELGGRAGGGDDADLTVAAASLKRMGGGPARQLAAQLARAAERAAGGKGGATSALGELTSALTACLVEAFASRVGRQREVGGGEYLLASGRGARLRGAGGRPPLLLALDLDAGRRGEGALSEIRRFAPVEMAHLEVSPRWAQEERLSWDAARGRVIAERISRFDGLVLARAPMPLQARAEASRLLRARAEADPEAALGTLEPGAQALLCRLATLARGWPELELPSGRAAWLASALPTLCEGRASFSELGRADLGGALLAALPWRARALLDRELPERLEVPSGSRIQLHYQEAGPPILAVKVQELFGLRSTPTVASGRISCLVHLLNPAGRPLQVTMDLESFWTRTWPAVRAEMRSRYPRHRWPEDPLTAAPSRHSVQRRRRS